MSSKRFARQLRAVNNETPPSKHELTKCTVLLDAGTDDTLHQGRRPSTPNLPTLITNINSSHYALARLDCHYESSVSRRKLERFSNVIASRNTILRLFNSRVATAVRVREKCTWCTLFLRLRVYFQLN